MMPIPKKCLAQNGSIEFVARATPSGGLEEPVRGFPFFLLSRSFEEIEKDADAESPKPDLNAFIAKPDMSSLAKLREHGVVSVADSARPAWSHLLTTNDSAACNILGLCALARKHVRVIALKPKVKKMSESQ